MASSILLDLMGAVALLLWGLHMVQSGILRAFGADLRRVLAKMLGNRVAAFAAGLGLTVLLQSSTATAIMAAGFAGDGVLGLVPALSLLLGANVGTALVVKLFSFDVRALAPFLFICGLVVFRFAAVAWSKNLGRVSIGLGLMLLALHLLIDALTPAETSPGLRMLFAMATGDPVLCILIGTIFTWAAHSSVATVLLVMSLAYSGFVTPQAALALTLGANLGSAINPLIEGTKPQDPATYRLPLGNLLNRLVGICLAAPFLGPISRGLMGFEPEAAQTVAYFHLLFNLGVAAIFIGVLGPLARFLTRALPAKQQSEDPGRPRYLDDSALDVPSLALADAARETLRMGDLVAHMLRQVMAALMDNDKALVAEVGRLDNAVDRLEEAIKLFVTQLTRKSLQDREGRRALEIITFAINLEHIGDIIDKNLSELAAKKIKKRLQFSQEGGEELKAFHARVMESLKLALMVFMTSDVAQARALLRDKSEMRQIERAAAERHLARLRDGHPDSLETTSLHLDVLRDLKRIHSHICAVAYPLLKAHAETQAVEGSALFKAELTQSAGF